MEVEKKKKRRKKTMYISLDDGVFVIVEDYITESKNLRFFYRCRHHGAILVPFKGISSGIIRKAFQFSKDCEQIKKQHKNKNDDDDDEDNPLLLQQKLQAFDHNFLRQNLADVACRLQMKSLFYLTRKAAAEMIAQKTPDDIRKILDTYYDENKTNVDDYDYMKIMYSLGF